MYVRCKLTFTKKLHKTIWQQPFKTKSSVCVTKGLILLFFFTWGADQNYVLLAKKGGMQ